MPLSGAVLLTSINGQLGGVGYTVAVEYAFYVFFGLSTLCIVSVLAAERFRVAGRQPVAVRTEVCGPAWCSWPASPPSWPAASRCT
jgi:branched-chain amino acid transport system substrate-binding protein